MCPRPRRPAWVRARSSIADDRSTATTDPGRCASGRASRPGPQPNSSVDIGANCGASPASMTSSIHATSVSPLAKNCRSCSGVRFARRKRGSVMAEKYGSLDTDAVHPQAEMALVAADARHEGLRRLDRDAALRRLEQVGRYGHRLLEVAGGIERTDLASPDCHADVRRRVEITQRVLAC